MSALYNLKKNLRGYRTEDVDRFLDKVEEQLQQNDAQAEQLRKQIADLTAENQKLKGELQSFEADGDMLKSALINAQRMGDSIIHESKQKAAEIIRSANIKAEDREQRARDDVELAKQEIVTLKGEADSFKRSLIEMYRKHINLINKLPDYTRRSED